MGDGLWTMSNVRKTRAMMAALTQMNTNEYD
jgi:hypothetical protein